MSRPRYFTPSEVSAHNTAEDLWVSFLGQVLDLTALAQRHRDDALLLPLLESAGKDISSWFDAETKDVRHFIDPVTQCRRYYTPRGRFLHVPPTGPCSEWACKLSPPWWKDRSYYIGLLSKKTRWIKVINTLTAQELWLEVCSEETLEEILRRYLLYNSHARSYTWKYQGAALDMSRTLEENGLHDQDPELDYLQLDREKFSPVLLLHFNDDLTEA